MDVLERIRPEFQRRVEAARIGETTVTVQVKPLTPEEAIGHPDRTDYPILIGKERVIEARVRGGRGHAFTDTPRPFTGRLGDVVDSKLDDSGRRAVYVATLNALLYDLGEIDGALHCRDGEPERCGEEIARRLREDYGAASAGLIGLNPAIADHLVRAFGADRVRITDLNPNTIGTARFGVEIWDGAARVDELVTAVDVVLVTGTTIVNGTFDGIWQRIAERGKRGILFGVTAAGASRLLGYERICPYARG
jgi:hypothetical protein